jgi:amicyanin
MKRAGSITKRSVEMKKTLLSAAAAALLVLGLGLSRADQAKPAVSGPRTSHAKYEVKIDNFSFAPPALTVPVGATVTWTNHDDVPHNVVSSEGKTLRSPVLDTDQKFTYTFTKAGTYPYYCGIHPKMTAQVIVQ